MPVTSGSESLDAEGLREAEKVKEAKRKGRFQIVENEDKARIPKSQVVHCNSSRFCQSMSNFL